MLSNACTDTARQKRSTLSIDWKHGCVFTREKTRLTDALSWFVHQSREMDFSCTLKSHQSVLTQFEHKFSDFEDLLRVEMGGGYCFFD